MKFPFPIPRSMLLAAAAGATLLATPMLAAAQSYGPDYGPGPDPNYNNQGGTYYDPCKRSQADRSVVGGLLGAVAGATLGNSVTHGGAKLGRALIGGVAGAAAGASIGHATAACDPDQPAQYAGRQDDQDYGPPPPPPPPGAYVPNEDDRYAGPPPERPDYRDAPRERCQMVEDRVFYPDGTTESTSIQACRDPSGRWHVADGPS